MTYEEHLKAENEHLQEELRAALTSKHVAINKNEVLREDIHKLKRENQSLRGDCDILRRDRDAAEKAVRRLESDNAHWIEQRDVAEKEVQRLWNENDALRTLAAKCKQDRLLPENEALRRENERLKCADIPYLRDQGEVLYDNLAAMKSTSENLMRDLTEARAIIHRLTTKQPPPGGHGDVWADIIAKLPADHPMLAKCIARRELGLARYGQPLRYGTGRPEDCEEELLDAAGYAWRDGWPWALVLHLLDVAAGPDSVRKLVLDIPVLRTRVQDLEVGLDTLRGWLARDRDLLTSATWCLASLVTSGDSAPAKDLLAARELMDEIHRTLTRRAGGER